MNEKLVRLQNILNVKSSEKDVIQSEYQEAINQFEIEGKSLFNLLKKKEMLEESIRSRLQTGVRVEQLMQQQYFMSNLEKTLALQQRKVSHARAFMNLKEEKLRDQTIECKKYEKLFQNEVKHVKQNEKRLDLQFLDELSIIQYTHQPNR